MTDTAGRGQSSDPTATAAALPLEFRPQDVIRFLIDKAAPVLNEIYEADSCIAQTRIALNVLWHFGVPAQPQPVRVVVWNDLAFEFWRNHGWHDDQGIGYDYRGEQGRYSVAIEGNGSINGTKWNAHLIALCPRERTLVDMTLHQMSRPKWGINLEPVAVSYEGVEWDPNNPECIAPYRVEDGTVVAYWPLPNIDPKGWRDAPDWTDSRGFIRITTRALIDWLERLERHEDVELVAETQDGVGTLVLRERADAAPAGRVTAGTGWLDSRH